MKTESKREITHSNTRDRKNVQGKARRRQGKANTKIMTNKMAMTTMPNTYRAMTMKKTDKAKGQIREFKAR